MKNKNFDPDSWTDYLRTRIRQLESQVKTQCNSLHALQVENRELKKTINAIEKNRDLTIKWARGAIEN